jgi:hypothetical protein
MVRKVIGALVISVLLVPVAASADSAAPKASSSRSSSTTRRVVWTAIGAGAGFAAGVFLGLNKFDDAIDSDRKVWTAALLGAAGGGVAGALLSRNVGSKPKTGDTGPEKNPGGDTLGISWDAAVNKTPRRPLR